jgi:hypothetical protein
VTLVASESLAMVMVPVWEPAVVGANATPTAQLEPGAIEDPQLLLVRLNPLVENRKRLDSATPAPEFVIVTETGLLVVPTPVVGKLTREGSACTAPVIPPMPLRTVVAGMEMLVEVTINAPVSVPREAGVNTTAALQFDPAARTTGHVLCESVNGPEMASAKPFAAISPVFEIVTVWGPLG